MLLTPKQTTVAYRCPHCAAGVMSAVGLFNLSADMVKLKCTCGQSELRIEYDRDETVRLTVPCMICAQPHHFTVRRSTFFSNDLFVLPCPYSDVNICMTGDVNLVKAELARTELALLDLLEENGLTDLSALHGDTRDLGDPQVRDIIMFVINDLDAEGKIYCRCHPAPAADGTNEAEGTEDRSSLSAEAADSDDRCEASGDHPEGSRYEAELTDEGIRVSCRVCGASHVLPTDSLLSAHAFLNADSLHLE